MSLKDINLNEIEANGFVDMNAYNQALNKLKPLKTLIEELEELSSTDEHVHAIFSGKINSYVNIVNDIINRIQVVEKGTPEQITQKKSQLLKQIDQNYNAMLGNQALQNNGDPLLTIYSAAKSLSDSDLNSIQIKQQKLNDLEKSLSDKEKQLDDMISTGRKSFGKENAKDFAKIFNDQSINHNNLSNNWLKAGISGIILFIITLIVFTTADILPTNKLIEFNGKEHLVVNYSGIISRIVTFSLIVYFIGFAFKQYSINKHQESINIHRRNALNSYELFDKSLPDDLDSKRALMTQVAKAIYDNQSTGYISDKSTSYNSNIFEFAKGITENK